MTERLGMLETDETFADWWNLNCILCGSLSNSMDIDDNHALLCVIKVVILIRYCPIDFWLCCYINVRFKWLDAITVWADKRCLKYSLVSVKWTAKYRY